MPNQMTIVKFTNVGLKLLKVLPLNIRRCWCIWHVCDANNILLNYKQSRKWFKFEWGKYKPKTSTEPFDIWTQSPKAEYYQGNIIKFEMWRDHLNGTIKQLKWISSWTHVELLGPLMFLNHKH